ncbi:hypothetical protein [Ignavibacterium album]|uniref:hypothetical protein n=1 Tax=Ignavibacterium album TaxID=591197 RepID=UPI0035B9A51A
MINKSKISFIIIAIYLFTGKTLFSQSFGFGCLGLVGGYAGYNYQQYQPGLLNDYVDYFNLNTKNKLDKFGKAEGYRFGINFFRAKFSGFFVTAKGFYQQLSESHSGQKIVTNELIYFDNDLKLNSWGLGLDVGVPIFNGLHWKILDGAILINSAKLTQTQNSSVGTLIQKFSNDKTELGYSFGSGFVVEILKNYISIEGIIAFTHLKIDKMKTDENFQFKDLIESPDENETFINSGGFNAVLQLNVGFPL